MYQFFACRGGMLISILWALLANLKQSYHVLQALHRIKADMPCIFHRPPDSIELLFGLTGNLSKALCCIMKSFISSSYELVPVCRGESLWLCL